MGLATHLPGILAWTLPCTEEPGGLQSMGSQRVEHNSDEHFHDKHRDNVALLFSKPDGETGPWIGRRLLRA